MSKIRNANPDTDIKESGYYSIVEDENLARIFQRVQSTCISNGTEIEKMIFDNVKCKKISEIPAIKGSRKTKTQPAIKGQKARKLNFLDLVNFIKNSQEDIYFRSITISKKDFISLGLKLEGKENMILDSAFYCYKTKTLHLGEIKNGMGLDTKKSEKEIESLSELRSLCIKSLKEFVQVSSISIFIVLFICNDIKHSSIKTNRTDFEKYTGKQYCDLIGASYDEIRKMTLADAEDNRNYIYTEIASITPDEILLEEVKKRGYNII